MISRLVALIFLLLLMPEMTHAEADGPDTWQVHKIKEGGFLNIRKGPSVKFDIVGQIPADSVEIENRGCFPDFGSEEWAGFSERESRLALEMRWCRVIFDGVAGWVHSLYLTEY